MKKHFDLLIGGMVDGAWLLVVLAGFLLDLRRQWRLWMPTPGEQKPRDWHVLSVLLVLALGLPVWGQSIAREEEMKRTLLEQQARERIARGMDRETVQKSLQRDLVLLEVGPEADRFMKVHGYPAIYLLRTCSNATSKKLVQMFEAGELERLELGRIIEVINRHGNGEPVAAWIVAGNQHRLRNPDALRLWEENTLYYVLDLRVLEDDLKLPREQPKVSAMDAVKQWAVEQGKWPILAGVVVCLGVAWWIKRRKTAQGVAGG